MNPAFEDFYKALPKPITRESISSMNTETVLKEATIQRAVKQISYYILDSIYGQGESIKSFYTYGCKKINKKLILTKQILENTLYSKNPFCDNSYVCYTDVLPEVIRRLQHNFSDFDFRQDELKTYLIIDWS